MSKAYSEDERNAKKKALMEAAVSLFHESGAKSLNIRELTRRAGISQGGFYTFWEDKDALIIDVIRYRARQKLDIIESRFDDSLSDPRGFLGDHLYEWCIDMKSKINEKPLYKESLKLLQRRSADETSRIAVVYQDFLTDLCDHWIKNKAVRSVDRDGLINLFSAAGVLLTDHIQIDDDYFNVLLQAMINGALEKFIIV